MGNNCLVDPDTIVTGSLGKVIFFTFTFFVDARFDCDIGSDIC